MENVSDLAFQAAMAGYLVALVCFGIELAARRVVPTALEASSQRVTRSKVAVAVGGPAVADSHDLTRTEDAATDHDADSAAFDSAGPDDERPTQWGPLFGRAGLVVLVIGVLANFAAVATRGVAAGRLPLANMYEFVSFICACAALSWLVVLAKFKVRLVSLFVMMPIALLAFLAGTALWQPVGPIQPSLNSYWKWVHVTTVSASGSVLLVSGVASVLYLLRHRFDKRLAAGPDDAALADSLWSRLPTLSMLDKIAYRTAIVAFPVYTFAIIAGALWAEAAWGRYWGWDPKETVAFVSWVFYAGYLHARATSGWRGVRATWINILGFAAIVFNLFFVNYVISGLHSYAS